MMDGSSSDLESPAMDNPLAGAQAPRAVEGDDDDDFGSVEELAEMGAEALGAACLTGTGYPLTPDEDKRFRRDLERVLRKHDLSPDWKYFPEVKLAVTTAGIVVPRVIMKRAQEEQETDSHGGVQRRQEGLGQERATPEARLDDAPKAQGSEAASLLA